MSNLYISKAEGDDPESIEDQCIRMVDDAVLDVSLAQEAFEAVQSVVPNLVEQHPPEYRYQVALLIEAWKNLPLFLQKLLRQQLSLLEGCQPTSEWRREEREWRAAAISPDEKLERVIRPLAERLGAEELRRLSEAKEDFMEQWLELPEAVRIQFALQLRRLQIESEVCFADKLRERIARLSGEE